jgi:hypothetical protein
MRTNRAGTCIASMAQTPPRDTGGSDVPDSEPPVHVGGDYLATVRTQVSPEGVHSARVAAIPLAGCGRFPGPMVASG